MTKFGAGLAGLTFGSALVLASAAGNAADMYRGDAGGYKDGPAYAPVTSWTGFYLGGHVGASWGDVDYRDPFFGKGSGYKGNYSVDTKVFGGGQLGYNFQRGNFVYGVEIDLGYLNASGEADPFKFKYSTTSGFYGDFTGRLGYAMDRTLIYAKGGAAVLNPDAKVHYNPGSYSSSDAIWGWTAGGGVEYLLSPKWSIKGEYLHFEFDSAEVVTSGGTTRFDPTIDTVKFGVNYHVGYGYEPLK